VRASGGATAERSYYPALEGLLRAVGATHQAGEDRVALGSGRWRLGAGHGPRKPPRQRWPPGWLLDPLLGGKQASQHKPR